MGPREVVNKFRKRPPRRAKIFVQFTQLLGGKEDVMLITKVSPLLRCPARVPRALRFAGPNCGDRETKEHADTRLRFLLEQLFYVSPYQVSGTPPPLPFSTKPYLPQPKPPTLADGQRPLPPSAQWR